MECTEVKVHTQNIKPREYRVCVYVCVCSKQGCIRLTGIRQLKLVFVNECLGILSLILESEGKYCGVLI